MKIKSPGPVPKEALAYFRNKGIKPSFDYRDVWRTEHAATFTVAKAMQLDVLQDIRTAIDQAIENGETLQQFKNELTPTLQKKGWWGKKEMVDESTGEIITAQLGSPRRLKTIYRANLRTARSAGQYERAQRTKKALPYFRYGLGPSEEHRPEHVQWDGLILPVDHPFWQTHMPQNGWGCKCHVRQISQAEMDRRGWQVSKDPVIEMVPWENKRTGLVEWVPKGIDPGWDTNPGYERHTGLQQMIAGKLDTADPAVAGTIIRDLTAAGRFSGWVDDVIERGQVKGEQRVVGYVTEEIQVAVADQGQPLVTPTLMIDDKALLHAVRPSKVARQAALSIDEIRRLPQIIADPETVLWDTQDPALLYVFASDDRKGKIVVRVNQQRKGKTVNRVVTTGRIDSRNINDPRYRRIIE